MKRMWCLLLLFLVPGLTVYAQIKDSFLLKLEALSNDTVKVNHLIAYGKTLVDKDNKKAAEIFQQCLQLSKQLRYDLGIATSYRRIGYIHGQKGNYEEAINCFRTAVSIYKNAGAVADVLACHNNIGANFRQMGKVDSATYYYLMGIEQIESLPLEKENEATKLDMLSTYCLLNSNVSALYGNMGNVPKALEYGEKAISLARRIKDTVRIVLSMLSICHAHAVNKDFSLALNYAKNAVQLALLQRGNVALSKSYHVLSVCYTGLNKLDSAIYAGQKSMEYAKYSDQQLFITSFLDLADAYHKRKEFKMEEALLLKGLREFRSVHNIAFGRNVYEKLAYAKYALGQYKKAFGFFEKSIVYKDSMYSEENRKTVAQLEMQYQTAKKEKALALNQLQLAQKDLQLQKNRNYLYFSSAALIGTLLITAILLILYRHKKVVHAREMKAIQQQKELQMMQALMQGEEKERSRIARDLHDGVAGMLAAVKMHFSSMPAADELVKTEGYRQGMNLLNETTREIRKISHNLMPEVLLQHGLDEALLRYCNNVNNSKTLQIEYDSWGEIDRFADSFELSVYRIVQELIGNIVKHSKATRAMIQLNQQNDLLSISIEDNGIGFNTGSTAGGMGLKSLQSRIRAMNGKMEIDGSQASGVSAWLEFDIAELKKEIAVYE